MKTDATSQEAIVLLHKLHLEATHYKNTLRGVEFLEKHLEEVASFLNGHYSGGCYIHTKAK